MNKVITITIILLHLTSFGQSEKIVLSEKGDSIENLIPKKWKLLSSTNGDLNKDGIKDLAFVIENTNKNNIHVNKGGLGRDSINLNPRILGIYFGCKNGKLQKIMQSDSLIILQDSPTMDEPFGGVEILENGDLKFDFHLWYSAGSWSMSYYTYKFRFQNNKFELIGYDAHERHRGSGEETEYSIDFLTCKMQINKTIFDDDDNQEIVKESRDFKLKKLKSIQSLGKLFEWDFYGIKI